ncbi:hypothetical protein [Streptosporangium jomthongense]|uniref:Uncharacterized protein n=1 Tax=Streptosporangium jomthongense TaxID=1193683 RepID=A0ABV8F1S3_9ACTN
MTLDWSNRPVLNHPVGCVLCCQERITTGSSSPARHPPSCRNCVTYSGPRPDPCWACGTTAHFRDDLGRPTHKVCLEQALTRLNNQTAA